MKRVDEMKVEVIEEKVEEYGMEEEERRTDRVTEKLAKIFGQKFAEKYREALQRAYEIPKQKLNEMKPLIIELLKSSESFRAQFDRFDAILVTTPASVERFPPKKTSAGNWKVTMIWPGSQSLRGPFISVFVADESDAKLLSSTPEKPFILVGKLQQQDYMGDVTYSFRTVGIIELE
jgi:hypothetical protein